MLIPVDLTNRDDSIQWVDSIRCALWVAKIQHLIPEPEVDVLSENKKVIKGN